MKMRFRQIFFGLDEQASIRIFKWQLIFPDLSLNSIEVNILKYVSFVIHAHKNGSCRLETFGIIF